jgi:hypothetical protein
MIPALASGIIANLIASGVGFAARGAITGGPGRRLGPARPGLPAIRTVQPTNPIRLERQLATRRDLLLAQYRRR